MAINHTGNAGPGADAIKFALACLAIGLFASAEQGWMLLAPGLLATGLVGSLVFNSMWYARIGTRLVQFAAGAVAIGFIAYAEIDRRSDYPIVELAYPEYRLLIYLALTGAVILGVVLLNYLWLGPLGRHLDRVTKSALSIFARERVPVPRIISRQALASFSHADELKKWSELRDENVICEEGFVRIKGKLLGSESRV